MNASGHPSNAWSPLRTRRLASVASVLALAISGAGCASQPPVLGRNTMVGSLRASVASLESQNRKLNRDVADLQAERQDLEDRLVAEQAQNEALASRLNQDRELAQAPESHAEANPFENFGPPTSPPAPRAMPAGRPQGRKIPFAQIPGEIRPLSEDDEERPSNTSADDLFFHFGGPDDQSRLDDSRTRWMPVARDFTDRTGRYR
ncbi:MAG TPA: hypothetical protein VFT74_05035 [Isosphaeraceae bacterium]|nr:hypothetical protein [Isosphaeraceae bacterium]